MKGHEHRWVGVDIPSRRKDETRRPAANDQTSTGHENGPASAPLSLSAVAAAITARIPWLKVSEFDQHLRYTNTHGRRIHPDIDRPALA